MCSRLAGQGAVAMLRPGGGGGDGGDGDDGDDGDDGGAGEVALPRGCPRAGDRPGLPRPNGEKAATQQILGGTRKCAPRRRRRRRKARFVEVSLAGLSRGVS